VSNFSALLLNRNEVWYANGPVTYTVCDDQGGSEQITLTSNGAAIISLPDSNILRIDIAPTNDCCTPTIFAIDNVRFTPIDPVWLDPVDSGFLSGSQVTTNTDQLASGGMPIMSVAADGVTQAVVRIPASYAGQSLSVTVLNELGQQDTVANDGGVFALGESPQSAQSTLNVNAVDTPNGPMAFVIYLSPVNYARGSQDYNSSARAISLQIQSNDDPNYNLTANAAVLRPPVVLVHGLWGSASDWGRQGFAIPISGLFVQPVDYYWPLLQGVIATDPTYMTDLDVNNIPTSALGLSYNAGIVDTQILKSISDFKSSNNAAGVTADIVAHSMGGVIVRTIALEPWFGSNDDTYGHGPINKLITIGTPHLGSPLATDLLQGANTCIRENLAKYGNDSFITVTTSAGTINGGVGDLQGDGILNGFLSPALTQLFDAGIPPFPMALVSAIENSSNLSGLPYTLGGAYLYTICGIVEGDPLGLNLTPNGWYNVFGENSDAVVPLMSQLNGGTAGPNIPTLSGVIHSPGMEQLGFYGPTELDPASNVPEAVIYLLDEPPNGPDFQTGTPMAGR